MKVIRKDKRLEIWHGNTMLGYVTQTDSLFAIAKDGYAVFVCEITHDSEIIKNLKIWRKEYA